MNFDAFNFDPSIVAGIQAAGYAEPTPIQAAAIPPILQGRDVIGLAQTGTGKTAAFVLPILQRLLNGTTGKVRAAVISPTRELAEQTCEAFRELGKETGLRSIAIYGGVGMDSQLRGLHEGVDIVVGCPGRLLDHLWRGTLDFTQLQMLVIDEADRMFDMGFLPGVRGVLECILQERQTLLFSATMPEDIRRLVREILHDPVTVKIGRTLPAATVSHALYPVPDHLKTGLLTEVLREADAQSVLVFTRTKIRAQRVAQQLQRAGFKAMSLQGDMTQPQRQAAFDGFRDGYFNILVATDIAARGIDILRISHVINYDMPDDTDSYIHRIGRTGRINRGGHALTFITARDAPAVRELETMLKSKIERCTVDGFNYAAPAPQGDRLRSSHPNTRPRRPRSSAGRSQGIHRSPTSSIS